MYGLNLLVFDAHRDMRIKGEPLPCRTSCTFCAAAVSGLICATQACGANRAAIGHRTAWLKGDAAQA